MVYVAVLANINGNLPALAKALEKIEALKEEGYEIEKYYVLGNIVGLFPYRRKSLTLLTTSSGTTQSRSSEVSSTR